MQLVAFRVTKFRSLLDSGWIDVDRLCAITGKNETGKSTLLRALQHLSIGSRPSINLSYDWPHFLKDPKDSTHWFLECRFRLSSDDKQSLVKFSVDTSTPDEIVFSFSYQEHYWIDLPEESFPNWPKEADVAKILHVITDARADHGAMATPSFADSLTDFEDRVAARSGGWGAVKRAIIKEIDSIIPRIQAEVNEAQRSGGLGPVEIQQRQGALAKLRTLRNRFEDTSSIQLLALGHLRERIPEPIYVSDFDPAWDPVPLSELAEGSEPTAPSFSRRIINLLSERFDLDWASLQKLADDERNVVIRNTLDGFQMKLDERKYGIEFMVAGDQVLVVVKDLDEKDNAQSGIVPFADRSLGFRWYFVLHMIVQFATDKRFGNFVLLLDEPGLHLHPSAHSDLLKQLVDYSRIDQSPGEGEAPTIIYTTHLPFMLDTLRPGIIRIMEPKDRSFVASDNITKSGSATKQLLQSALGLGLSEHYLIANNNLIVEGGGDYLLLTELLHLRNRPKEIDLPSSTVIIPAGGANTTPTHYAFVLSQKLKAIVLLDTDGAANDAVKKIRKYSEDCELGEPGIIQIGEIFDPTRNDAAIEDLFGDEYVFACCAYDPSLRGLEIGTEDRQLAGRAALLFKNDSIRFDKNVIVRILAKRVHELDDFSNLSDLTQQRVIGLFERINNLFAG